MFKEAIMRVTIIYWSGTGNTARMAEAIQQGASEAGAETKLINLSAGFDEKDLTDADRIALGCPAMGAEELEEEEFRPFFDAAKPVLKTKPVAIFGSYEWNTGEWMVDWREECENDGISLVGSLAAYDNPDDEAIEKCIALGKKLAE